VVLSALRERDEKFYNYWGLCYFMGIIIKSNVRVYLDGMNLGEDLVVELERKVDRILKKAADRAKANFRRTVYARDL